RSNSNSSEFGQAWVARSALFAFALLSVATVFVTPSRAQTQVRVVHDDFSIPRSLEGRVDFWVRIFAQYGEHQVLVHHRDFPQAIFGSIDFSDQVGRLSPQKLAQHKKSVKATHEKQIEEAAKYLASGQAPKTELQQRVMQTMQKVPGGPEKYRKLYTEHLVRTQTGIKERFMEAVKRSGRYSNLIENIFVEEFGLPRELTLLPYVESSFDYKAYSSVGAAGIWQFMPRTARGFGLQVDRVVDERRDVITATRAAAKYLSQAYGTLGTWPLALTSYNHGVAGVSRKIKKIGTKDLAAIIEHPTERVFGFASTNFYPEFLAAIRVHNNYQKYFPGLQKEPARHVSTYRLPHAMSIGYISKKVGVSVEKLKEYNYALSSGVWSGAYKVPKKYILNVPAGSSDHLKVLKAPEPVGPTASSIYGGTSYRVRRGDTLSSVARKFRTTVSRLKLINGLQTDRVYVGQMLRVKASEATPLEPPQVSQPSKASSAPVANQKSYTVQPGDTLYSIGRRYGMSVGDLKQLNSLASTKISAGQILWLKSNSKAAPARTSTQYHTVKGGESLWSIARKYNTSVEAVKQANNLRSNSLKPGHRLRLP
ncbi:MAG: LysM peptidoglycan-binding domain-containing protein, partial [Bdellovibrionales bacterium]|nr:LysM peptidoglycan-binding domain-containing protein [Bdellovibrionales bacterium]